MADFQRQVNIPVTFNAIDSTITSHTWKIDGIVQPETTNSMTRTFSTLGVRTVRHEGNNTCGNCIVPIEHTVEIVETLLSNDRTGMVIVGTAAAIAIGYLLTRKKK